MQFLKCLTCSFTISSDSLLSPDDLVHVITGMEQFLQLPYQLFSGLIRRNCQIVPLKGVGPVIIQFTAFASLIPFSVTVAPISD